MKLSDGVSTDGLLSEIKQVLPLIDQIYKNNGQTAMLIQTTQVEPCRQRHHESGVAVDIKTPQKTQVGIYHQIRRALGSQFWVVHCLGWYHISHVGDIHNIIKNRNNN